MCGWAPSTSAQCRCQARRWPQPLMAAPPGTGPAPPEKPATATGSKSAGDRATTWVASAGPSLAFPCRGHVQLGRNIDAVFTERHRYPHPHLSAHLELLAGQGTGDHAHVDLAHLEALHAH